MVEARGQALASSLDFYIRYEYLSARDLGTLLQACSKLSDTAYRFYAESMGIGWDEPPVLEMPEIRTGESIKFKFTERLRPSISTDKENEIVIGVPKTLGIPALIGFLLISAADKALDMRSKYYDGEKTRLELQQIEFQLQQQDINKLRVGGDANVPRELERQSDDVIRSILNNPAFTFVSINGVEVKRPHSADSSSRE